jgi:nicotinate-nucleotide adenylyltransferase
MRVAIIGGSFNPPHLGHLLLATQLLATREPDEVWLAPVLHHAFGKPLAPFEDRLAMVELAVAPLGPRLKASRIEEEAGRAGSSGTTVELLRFLRGRGLPRPLLAVGADIMLEKQRWASFEEVEQLAELVVVDRAGFPPVAGGVPLPEISSTDVRDRLARGLPVSSVLPAAVERYVLERQLYS